MLDGNNVTRRLSFNPGIQKAGTKKYHDEAVSGIYFVFKQDGTGYCYEEGFEESDAVSEAYKWKLEDDKLTLAFTKSERVDIYKILTLKATELKLESSDDEFYYVGSLTKK